MEISVENVVIPESSILNNKAFKMLFQISEGLIFMRDIPVGKQLKIPFIIEFS